MIKLNETSANLNVLSEDALTQVVGGSCHRGRGGYGHCGGYRPRSHCGGHDRYESYDDGYEGSDSSSNPSGSSSNNVQVVDVSVAVNVVQVQS